jgi:hypothetical protein
MSQGQLKEIIAVHGALIASGMDPGILPIKEADTAN